MPLFKSGSTTTYATNVNDVVGSTSTNILWELDGYSAYSSGKPDTSGTGAVPLVWTQADYSNSACQLDGYTQGPGYYRQNLFPLAARPRGPPRPCPAPTLQSYLGALGVNSTDQTTLANIWSTWQGQGTTGLTNLQNWLTGTAKGGASSLPTFSGYYTPTSTTAWFRHYHLEWRHSDQQQQATDLLCRLPALQPRLSFRQQQRRLSW